MKTIWQIHESAKENINGKAEAIVSLITKCPPDPMEEEAFPSHRVMAATLTEEDIIGEVEAGSVDYSGRTVGRFFYSEGGKYGIEGEHYQNLIRLSEQILKNKEIYKTLSQDFTEKKLFDWARIKFNHNSRQTFLEFLEQEATASIGRVCVWTPLANLEIEHSIIISKSRIDSITPEVIEKWMRKFHSTQETSDQKRQLEEHIRKEFQGLAAVVTEVEAEPLRAIEIAREEAEIIVAILGVFSPAMLCPDMKCITHIKGSENVACATAIMDFNSEKLVISSSITTRATTKNWRLGQIEIKDMYATRLAGICDLLATTPKNDFQVSALNALYIYSKAAFTSEPVEKLVYILSSLESMLLKNENEPIQQNLAERLALVNDTTLDKRKATIRSVKLAYGIRSRYLHHGNTRSEIKVISDFMLVAWVFFFNLSKNTGTFTSRDDFVGWIDDRKLS